MFFSSPRFEPGTSRIQVISVTDCANLKNTHMCSKHALSVFVEERQNTNSNQKHRNANWTSNAVKEYKMEIAA